MYLLYLPKRSCHKQQQQKTTRKRYEKLLQIQFRILRKRYLYPQRRFEIIYVYKKRSQRYIIFYAESVFRFRKSVKKKLH